MRLYSMHKPAVQSCVLVPLLCRAVILQLLVQSSSTAHSSGAAAAAPVGSSKAEEDPLPHLAAVVNNVTQFKEGRTLLVSPASGGSQLPALASQLTVSNPKRRWGCASALHNCCFHAQVCVCPAHPRPALSM